jgi:indolepyruvate decarboxylase
VIAISILPLLCKCATQIPYVLGCDGWFTARVTTCGELDQALKSAEQDGAGAYIAVVTDKYAAPPEAMKMRENIKTLYQD